MHTEAVSGFGLWVQNSPRREKYTTNCAHNFPVATLKGLKENSFANRFPVIQYLENMTVSAGARSEKRQTTYLTSFSVPRLGSLASFPLRASPVPSLRRPRRAHLRPDPEQLTPGRDPLTSLRVAPNAPRHFPKPGSSIGARLQSESVKIGSA